MLNFLYGSSFSFLKFHWMHHYLLLKIILFVLIFKSSLYLYYAVLNVYLCIKCVFILKPSWLAVSISLSSCRYTYYPSGLFTCPKSSHSNFWLPFQTSNKHSAVPLMYSFLILVLPPNLCYIQLCLLFFPKCRSLNHTTGLAPLSCIPFLLFVLKLFYHSSHLTLFCTHSSILAHREPLSAWNDDRPVVWNKKKLINHMSLLQTRSPKME